MEDGHAELSPEEIARRKEADAPVTEAGGGESEGFEQSEQELVDMAEGESGRHHPLGDRFPAEETDVRDHTAFGDADEVQSDAREHEND